MTVHFLPEHLSAMRLTSAVQSAVDKHDGLRVLMQLAAKGLCVTLLPVPTEPPVGILAAIPLSSTAAEVLFLPSTGISHYPVALVKACRARLKELQGMYERITALSDEYGTSQRFLRFLGFVPVGVVKRNGVDRELWEYTSCGG